ncbi:hypothetical protein TNCV_2019891 [Trichonephila clavipes]|nr:hypothetical protein TNCV_2019891 [Trichonephila clavipes]
MPVQGKNTLLDTSACKRATKSVFVVSTSQYSKSLRLPPKGKKNLMVYYLTIEAAIEPDPPSLDPAARECHIQLITNRSTEMHWSPILNRHPSLFTVLFS